MEKMSEKGAQISEVTDDTKMTIDKLENEIWEEIVDFILWEFCIEVHRATKLNYLYLDPDLDPDWDENNKRIEAAKDDLGQEKSKKEKDRKDCPNCPKIFKDEKYLCGHLLYCLGLVKRKKSGREKKQESDTKCDTNVNSGRKTSQKSRGQKKSNAPGNSSKSSGEDNDIFKNMTSEEINQFLVKKCGVLTARSKKRCMNSVKCVQHIAEAKKKVRETYSKNPGDNAGNDQRAEKGNLESDFP